MEYDSNEIRDKEFEKIVDAYRWQRTILELE
jgi:hypothetical protein